MLEKCLNIKGYQQSELTPGFWTHTWRPIYFSLCMDAFGVKYNGNQHTDYPISVLKEHYTISKDWKGQLYLGLDLDWDYKKRVVQVSMLKYFTYAIKRFQHKHPQNPQDQPYPHINTIYGAKSKYSRNADNSSILEPAERMFLQEVTGDFL